MRFTKEPKGITLLALIITIIVLVILAGVALNTLFGNDGILNNAQYAKEQYVKSTEKEAISKAFSELQIKRYMNEEENEITAELLEQQLRNAGNNVEVTTNEAGNFVITFKNTGDVYEVTPTGKILGEDKTEVADEPEERVLKYVEDGILAYYDGIDNTREGHNAESNVWEDLIGNKDIELRNFENNTTDVWIENGIVLDGSNDGLYLGNNFKDLFKSDATLELVLNIKDSSRDVFFGNYSQSNNINLEKKTNLNSRVYWNNGGYDAEQAAVTVGEKITISFRINKTKSIIDEFINGQKVATYSNSKIGEYNYDWTEAWIGKDNRSGSDVVLGGTIYKVRIYNKTISDTDILCNYKIDIGEEIKVGNGNIPIYNANQLTKMGSDEKVYIDNEKKTYQFALGKTYEMQNDITFYGDFATIQELINKNQIVLDENGHTLTIVNSTNPEYFSYSGTTTATITGFSTTGRELYNEGKLTEIIFPSVAPNGLEIKSISDWAFDSCSRITEIELPKQLTSLGKNAFISCTNLTKVGIPKSLTSCAFDSGTWQTGPFGRCSKLTTIEWEEGITTIPAYLFANCTGITSIAIPNTVTTIGTGAYKYCTGTTSIVIPSTVTNIGSSAFEGCTGLTNITIPNSVKSISEWAFYNCSGITEVKLSNQLTSLGKNAFVSCTNLTKVNIPKSLTSCAFDSGTWQTGPFGRCSKLTTIEWEEGITKIPAYLFANCTGLTSITIPNTVTAIGEGAYKGCTGLTNITIPNSITSIGSYVFSSCTAITQITIPDSITSIGTYAFSGCTGLTNITIPNSVKSISEWAFYNCSGITEVKLSNQLTSLGKNAFVSCTNLTKVNIPKSLTSCAFDSGTWQTGPFGRCSKLTTIEWEEGITKIPAYLFANCTGLTSITIPNTVTTIGEGAYKGCTGLTNITIPNTVTSIESYAFSGCTGLAVATYGGNEKQWIEAVSISGNQPLLNANITFQSEVPAGSKVTDKSGGNRTLFLMKETSIGEDSNGKYLSFDGTDDYAQIRKLDSTINWADGFTIEFKAQWNAFNNWSRILDFGNGQNSDNIVVANNARTNTLVCSTRKGSTDKSTSIATLVVGEVATYKLEYVKNGSNTYNISIKKNGEEIHTDTSSVILNNIDRVTNYLGKSNWADAYFNGKIYSLKITQADGTVIVWYDLNN